MRVHGRLRTMGPAAGLALVAPALALLTPTGAQAAPVCNTVTSTVTCTFDYTGATQTWTVPAGVTSATFDLYGASGGDSGTPAVGGNGAHVQATLAVTPGTAYDLEVGQRGTRRPSGGTGVGPSAYNGGGPGYGYESSSDPEGNSQGGGGATDLRTSAGGLADRLLVAGGGGGAAYRGPWHLFIDVTVTGGAGGGSGSPGASGQDVVGTGANGGGGGGAGTSSAGGAGGTSSSSEITPVENPVTFPPTPGSAGSSGEGGSGGAGIQGAPGGGGGGGYFGGGGGGGGSATDASLLLATIAGGGGGGGGSSFVTPPATNESVVEGDHDGDGEAVITYTLPAADTTIPSVTINQASAQADPTSSSPVVFDVVFSEPVTGFGNDDITLSGTAGATNANVSGTAGGATYTVSVSGMTTSGTVIADVKAGAATDGTNSSAASSSTDHTVTYNEPDTSVPSVTINQGSSQADPTSSSPVVFDVVFSESVDGFSNDDIDLSGTAGATTANVSGTAGGATYTVSVSGMTSSGTVIAAVKAGAATDGTNTSAASTSTDNTVTYNQPPNVFDPGPTATITGTAQVGRTLTAGEGSPSPTPDSFRYQWFADGTEISSADSSEVAAAAADGKTFLLTETEVGKAITVQVTAVKTGFTDASDTSDPTGLVAPADSDGDGDGDDGGDGDGDDGGDDDGDGDDEGDDDDGGMLPDAGAPVDEIVLLVGLALLVGGIAALKSTRLSSRSNALARRQES